MEPSSYPARERGNTCVARIDPDSVGRRLFEAGTIEAHLDRLADGQADDGGWTLDWLAWSPVAASEWRGSLTVSALLTLRANGRV